MKPDKLPTIDTRAPNLYRRIIDAAAEVRASRQTVNVMAWATIRAKRVESLQFVKRED